MMVHSVTETVHMHRSKTIINLDPKNAPDPFKSASYERTKPLAI